MSDIQVQSQSVDEAKGEAQAKKGGMKPWHVAVAAVAALIIGAGAGAAGMHAYVQPQLDEKDAKISEMEISNDSLNSLWQGVIEEKLEINDQLLQYQNKYGELESAE
ncbi:hypothetical protein [Bifidobacterium samirii]|uniref:Uncharacterized protein n=1 Tax=Bifidobacterium samirii TaxID=2306974 RepID=A0A430FVX7_9BIFI|nr:hypothetical protein [Bifidobacterium samirii]RSX58166.1 hypothetical protein D2E24_0526 [Bifidobacterium samirii]